MDLCEEWQCDFHKWDKDCALVSQYYSGKKMETPEDEDVLGLVTHHNYQFGRETINRAKEETFSFWTTPRLLMQFRLKTFNGSPREKKKIEERFSTIVDKLVRKRDSQFMFEMEELADRGTLHGDAVLCFHPQGQDWRPFQAKIITDKNSPQNPHNDNFFRWAVYHELEMGAALEGIANDEPGWTKAAKPFLEAVFNKRYNYPEVNGHSHFDAALTMYRNESPEEWDGDLGNDLSSFCETNLKTFYYFEKDFSKAKDGKIPVDLSIISRVEGITSHDGKQVKSSDLPDPLLFHEKDVYDSSLRAIHDFIQDSNLGVQDKNFTTIKGLGHLNYTANRMVNILNSSLINSAIEANTVTFQFTEGGGDQRKLEDFVKNGYKAYSILPAGLDFAQKPKLNLGANESIAAIRHIESLGAANAVSQTGQSQGTRDELRVNAAQRHQQDQKIANNRGRVYSMKIERAVSEMGMRICEGLTQDAYDGRAKRDMDWLKEEMKLQEVDWSWFQTDNIEIHYPRLNGDGDPEKRFQIVSEQMRNIGVYSPEKRPEILRDWHAALTDNWQEADEFFLQDGPPADQQALAMDKAATMMTLGQVVPTTKNDVPEAQIPVLLGLLQQQVDIGTQQGAFTPQQYQGGLAIGQHIAQLILTMEQQGSRQSAQIFSAELQRISTEAQGPANNLKAQQEQQQDPKAIAALQDSELKQRKQNLEEQKFGLDIEKSQLRQQGQDRRQQFNEYMQQSNLAAGESKQVHKEEIDSAKLEIERLRAELDAAKVAIKANNDR